MPRKKLNSNAAYPTIPDAARRSGAGERWIERKIRSGELGVYWLGGWRHVSWAELQALIESTRVEVSDEAA